MVNRPFFFIITHKSKNFHPFRKLHICERKLIFAFRNIISVLSKKKGLVPDLSTSPAWYIRLFFHDFQHHSGSQLKAVLEDQAIRDGLMLSHTIGVFLKQFFLLIRQSGFELFFVSTYQFQQFLIFLARGCVIPAMKSITFLLLEFSSKYFVD